VKNILTMCLFVSLTMLAWGQDPSKRVQAKETDEMDRFQVAVHAFDRNGERMEVLIKLDRHTGKAWQFEGAKDKGWKAIPESKEGKKPATGESPRYELVCHTIAVSKEGKEDELYVRFDRKTGTSWKWSGTKETWTMIEQDD
jgi:hypothetical protein